MLKINLKYTLTTMFLTSLLLADNTAVIVDRNGKISDSIIYGDKASDIPISAVLHQFQQQNINVMNNIDASPYPDAKVYVGYGVYDPKEDNCIYVDMPTSDGSNIKMAFQGYNVFNGHAYGISRTAMSLSQCQAITAKYFGYPAMITTSEENSALNSFYPDKTFWLSTSQQSCSEPYRDRLNRTQQYFSWKNNNEPECDETKLRLAQSVGLDWDTSTGGEARYCVVEFDTPDYEHPIKSCAPWWTIERTFKAPAKDRYTVHGVDEYGKAIEFDIRTINQKDFPMNVEVCVQVATDANTTDAGLNTVVCNSYYDIRRSPRCSDNIKQDVCYVNECRGTIQNTCEQIDVMDAPLPYAKMTIVKNGEAKVVKGIDGIKMHKYRCPAVTEQAGCLKTSVVSMLPQVCPGTEVDANGTAQTPTKVYGSPNLAGKYENGILKALYGICPDGTKIEVPVDIYQQQNRICKKYQMIDTNTTRDEMCVLQRPYSDYTVDTSITANDAYANNPNCVRLNDAIDARPRQDIIIDYATKGFANIEIVKARMDGRTQDVSPVQIKSNYYAKVIANGQYGHSNYSTDLGQGASPPNGIVPPDCSDYQDGIFLSSYLYGYVINGATAEYDYFGGDLVVFGNIAKSSCENIASQYANSNILWGAISGNQTDIVNKNNQYESLYGFVTKTGLSSSNLIRQTDVANTIGGCVMAIAQSPVSGDVYSKLLIQQGASVDAAVTRMSTTSLVGYTECRRLAACSMSDVVNANHYSGNQVCQLDKTATSGSAAWDEIRSEAINSIPLQNGTVVTAQNDLGLSSVNGELPIYGIDGLSDIFAVVEYTDYEWGYYGSYSARNFTSNIVRANGLVVSPIAPHPRIVEQIYENYHWTATSHRNKKLATGAKIALGVGASGGVDTYGGLTIASMGSFASFAWVVSWFSGDIVSFTSLSESEVYNKYNPLVYRYTPNANPRYETRFVGGNKLGEASVIYNEFSMGVNENIDKSMESAYFQLLRDAKTAMYQELNIDMGSYVWPYYEKSLPIADPDKCKWYDPWCRKDNAGQDGWKLLAPTSQYHKRTLTSHYFGATNSVTLVVPYIGDYEIAGYNKYGQLIGKAKVLQSAFIGGEAVMKHTQAYLGSSMQIAPGVAGGDACVNDTMVEVGGGVQGPYYEMGDTGTYANFTCGRGNYEYTKEHAITELTIRPLTAETPFRVRLPKPLPYANRIWVASMGLNETREYRCFSDFGDCTNYKPNSGNVPR